MNYNDEYFFIRKPSFDESLPQLLADDTTSMLGYSFEALRAGAPLIFTNALRERYTKKRIRENIGEVLFEGSELVVSGRIRSKLLDLNVPHLHPYPAIYIDDQERWHEDHWFLTFTERFDCWSRSESVFEGKPIEGAGMKLFDVMQYRLDKYLFDKTPLNKRLLFKMGGAIDAFITVHTSIAALFAAPGVDLQKITDY
jgi:hypothetical protein